MTQIGRRAWPIDWETRSVGAAPYTGDLVPPGALAGTILRSPHPHALIESIDMSEATRAPGVRAVVTSADFPDGARYALYRTFDRPPLADGVVRSSDRRSRLSRRILHPRPRWHSPAFA